MYASVEIPVHFSQGEVKSRGRVSPRWCAHRVACAVNETCYVVARQVPKLPLKTMARPC